MAVPTDINFNVVDAADVEGTQFNDYMKNWLTNAVDILNSTIRTINNIFDFVLAINTLDIGSFAIWIDNTTPYNVPQIGLTPSGFVVVRLISSSLPTTINTVTPGTNQFTVTFNADPGASAIIAFEAYSQNPQG